MANFILNIVTEKCPYCGEGDVFKKIKFYRIPEMYANCSSCKRDFTGEPGYFFGAMYISYGIAVSLGILSFLICTFLLKIESLYIVLGISISSILLISFKNFKWSRIIWLKIFPPGENTNFINNTN